MMRRNRIGAIMAAAVTVCAVAAGCGSARRGPPSDEPLAIDDPQVALGQRAFMGACHECHPNGMAGLGPAINDKPLPGFLIKTQVRAGMGAMPEFSSDELSDEQLDGIVAYLKALREHG